MKEQLAIIKNFHIGVGDRGVPAIWFDTYVDECSAALQVIHGAQEIWDFIQASGLSDITKIVGKPCWVQADSGMIKFVGLAKI
jgi:hypothetical protein